MNIIEELGAAKVVGITGHIRPDGALDNNAPNRRCNS